jgi:hypothetical protein
MASVRDHLVKLLGHLSAHHNAMAETHEACEKSIDDGGLEGEHGGPYGLFHKNAGEHHRAMAEKCDKVCEACEKSDDAGGLEKITPVEKALLARLAKTVVPDHVRSVGTDNPNRLIARQGDPQPETSDAEIPAEFVEVFQT